MRKKFVQLVALCVVLVLLPIGRASVSAAAARNKTIRVGLHYGTGAMEGINLENGVGAGFRFGYYDNANQFVELGSTGQTAISAVQTTNVYYGSYGGYTSYHTALAGASNIAVGCYHLQLSESYGSYAKAQAAASRYSGGFPAYIGGRFYARIGNFVTQSEAKALQGELAATGVDTKIIGTSAYGISVVTTRTSNILFQYDDEGASTGLGIEPIQTGVEKCATWSKGYLYNGGFRFERVNGGSLTVVNILELEDYVKGVLPAEMSTSWPMEAMKAQAVAIRSYAIALGTKHGAHHFDICSSTHCQAYRGRNGAGSNSDEAVEQTAGQVAISGGSAAQTFYYSSNGGASESVSVVWGSNQSSYPYLTGKQDPYEITLTTLNNNWTRTFTSAQIISKVLSRHNVNGAIVSAAVSERTPAGNPKTITFTDSTGKIYKATSASVYSGLGLPSFNFWLGSPGSTQPTGGGITINGSVTLDSAAGLYAIDGKGNRVAVNGAPYVINGNGSIIQIQPGQGTDSEGGVTAVNGAFTFSGKGFGHNVGMSQWGAYAMANLGHTYLEILQFYYTGITVGYM